METKLRDLELTVIFEICRVVGQALKLDQALDTILRILSDSLAMQRATVILKDDETGYLVIRASHGLTEAERKRGIYRPNEGVTGLIFSTAQPFVVPDISKEPLFLNKTRSRPIHKKAIAFLGVPILLHGKPIGVLHVDRLFGNDISFEEDIRFLSIVATLISQLVSLNLQVRLREEELRRETDPLRQSTPSGHTRSLMVGKSPAMLVVQEQIAKVAPSKASVLLLGESGTGKTLVARIIHNLSTRSDSAFVKINCAALPETLLESELFGYEKGAFTGAAKSKAGRFEEADGGTVFLDEVAELPLSIQAKLLRFLQEREFERLGSTKTRRVDVRIIAATNVELAEAVRGGLFREDLFYRLNVFPIRVPALRERKEDIPFLINHFLARTSKEYGRALTITAGAMDLLVRYEWPGNVREMENLIERLCIMADGDEIGRPNLPDSMKNLELPVETAEPLSKLERMEREEILAALERNSWLQSRTAKALGLTPRQMGYRVRKFGLGEIIDRHRQEKPPANGYRAI
ncbi:MAG: sigma 54-interacting transcriptional regulator [Syntrophobacteraceae bacterium]